MALVHGIEMLLPGAGHDTLNHIPPQRPQGLFDPLHDPDAALEELGVAAVPLRVEPVDLLLRNALLGSQDKGAPSLAERDPPEERLGQLHAGRQQGSRVA